VIADRHAPKVEALRERILKGPGHLDSSIRVAAAQGGKLPAELDGYVGKVADHSYAITDLDVDGLRRAGYTEDQIFELTLSSALGAGLGRLDVGLRALDGGAAGAAQDPR